MPSFAKSPMAIAELCLMEDRRIMLVGPADAYLCRRARIIRKYRVGEANRPVESVWLSMRDAAAQTHGPSRLGWRSAMHRRRRHFAPRCVISKRQLFGRPFNLTALASRRVCPGGALYRVWPNKCCKARPKPTGNFTRQHRQICFDSRRDSHSVHRP